MSNSLTFYTYLFKLLNFEKDPCHTSLGFKKFYTMHQLLRNVWGYTNDVSHNNFKEFERLGFIKRIINEKEKKPKYFIDVSSIKRYIKKESIFSMILSRIDDIESVF